MYATIRRYDGLDPTKADELDRMVNERLRPLVAESRGFVSYELMKGQDGSVTSIGIFASKADAQESNQAAAKWINEHAVNLIPNWPDVSAGELLPH